MDSVLVSECSLEKNSRSAKYDNIKGLLIFLVVFGHMLRIWMPGDPFSLFVYILIYSFHMPAFIFLVGKFTKPRWGRIGRYCLLYIVFQFIYTFVLKYIFIENISLSIITPYWILWFLVAIIAYTMFCFVLPESLGSWVKGILFGCSCVIAVAVGFISFIGEPFSLSRIIVFLPFFLAGRFGYLVKPRKSIVSVLCVILAGIFVLIYIVGSNGGLEPLYMCVGYSESNSTWFLRLLILAVGFCVIRFLNSIIPDKKIPILTDMGKHTLFIFLGHGFLVKLLKVLCCPQYPLLFAFVVSVVVTLMLWALASMIDKLKLKHQQASSSINL